MEVYLRESFFLITYEVFAGPLRVFGVLASSEECQMSYRLFANSKYNIY